MLATSCPRCGSEAQAGTSRCRRCGFVFFEAGERRRLRPPARVVGVVALAAAVIAGAALLLARGDRAGAPAPAADVPAAEAEHRLERRAGGAGYDVAAIRCRRRIHLGETTRCHVRYSNGDTQLILVALDARGALDVTVPYPAQRRPAH